MEKTKIKPHYMGECQVLTCEGWKKWHELGETETFVVPNLKNKKIKYENSHIVKEYVDNKNGFYRQGAQNSFFKCIEGQVIPCRSRGVKKVLRFDKIENLRQSFVLIANGFFANGRFTEELNRWRLVGLLLYLNQHRRSMHSRIIFLERQKDYIYEVLKSNDVAHWGEIQKIQHLSKDKCGACIVYNHLNIDIPNFVYEYIDENSLKCFPKYRNNVDFNRGILESFVAMKMKNSIHRDNINIKINPKREDLFNLLETVSILSGFKTRRFSKIQSFIKKYQGLCISTDKKDISTVNPNDFTNKKYSGEVFSAQTSTGYLIVRGDSDSFPSICCN